MMLHVIKALGLEVSDEKSLTFSSRKSNFSFCELDMQLTETNWTIVKEGHIRSIRVKFGQIPASSLGGYVL